MKKLKNKSQNNRNVHTLVRKQGLEIKDVQFLVDEEGYKLGFRKLNETKSA